MGDLHVNDCGGSYLDYPHNQNIGGLSQKYWGLELHEVGTYGRMSRNDRLANNRRCLHVTNIK